MTGLLLEMTRDLCGGRLVFALEGGYNADALKDSVAMVLWELVGRSKINKDEMQRNEDAQSQNITKTFERVKEIQKKYWGKL